MRPLWLPGQKRRVQQASARTAPHLLDGIRPFVQGIAWVADAGKGPLRPVGRAFGHDFSLAVRFGVFAGHDVKAVWADDAAVFRARRGHDQQSTAGRFKRLLVHQQEVAHAAKLPSNDPTTMRTNTTPPAINKPAAIPFPNAV